MNSHSQVSGNGCLAADAAENQLDMINHKLGPSPGRQKNVLSKNHASRTAIPLSQSICSNRRLLHIASLGRRVHLYQTNIVKLPLPRQPHIEPVVLPQTLVYRQEWLSHILVPTEILTPRDTHGHSSMFGMLITWRNGFLRRKPMHRRSPNSG